MKGILSKTITDLFTDQVILNKIQKKLPHLFQIAELETQRDGKIGMEVGSLREKIIISLLIYYFGKDNVDTKIPITAKEEDVRVNGNPLSIKTKTGSSLSGMKLIWTVDASKSVEFINSYQPSCDMLYIQIVWEKTGYLYYFPLQAQVDVLRELTNTKYIKLPKEGTNPRGSEISKEGMLHLIKHSETMKLSIHWRKEELQYDTFKKWTELWQEE